MKFFRITIITVILLTVGGFIIFTGDNDPRQQLLESIKYLESHHFYQKIVPLLKDQKI